MSTGIGRNLTEIAMMILAIAVIALIIGQGDKTARVIQAGGTAFADLLKIVTLQSGGNFGGF